VASAPTATPIETSSPEADLDVDRPWVAVLWNDPVNSFDYVILVLRKLFGYSKAKADQLTDQVHHEGRAVVSSGTREAVEVDVFRLHEHGLWATMQHDA